LSSSEYIGKTLAFYLPRCLEVFWKCGVGSHANWQVLDMGLPLGAHLEKLDSAPLLAVNSHAERQMVGLWHDNQPINPFDTLEFRIHITRFIFLFPDLENRLGSFLFCRIGHRERVVIIQAGVTGMTAWKGEKLKDF